MLYWQLGCSSNFGLDYREM